MVCEMRKKLARHFRVAPLPKAPSPFLRIERMMWERENALTADTFLVDEHM